MSGRKIGPRALALIKGFEQCRLRSYLPTPRDVPTIGWGATGPDIRLGMTWTQQQADARLAADLAQFEAQVDALLAGAPTTPAQFGALVSFAYNLGATSLARSTLLRLHRAGDFDGAAAQFARWNRQGPVVLAGLTRRRAAEAALYRGIA